MLRQAQDDICSNWQAIVQTETFGANELAWDNEFGVTILMEGSAGKDEYREKIERGYKESRGTLRAAAFFQ